MSRARRPSRSWIRARRASVQGSAPKMPARREVLVSAGLGQGLAEPQGVGGSAGEDVGLEVADQGDLAGGHAAGDGDDGGAELDGALVDAEAAGEQAVAVGVVHDAGRGGAGRGQGAGAHPGPQPQVVTGVGDEGGTAAGAARAVHDDDVLAGHGEQAEGIGLPQVALGGERQPGQVGQGQAGAAGDAGVAEPGGLEAAGDGEQQVDQGAQPVLLDGGQGLGGHSLGGGVKHGRY